MEIFLHVGAHRTATTTLQRMMGQSHAALVSAGISYWGPKRTRGGLFHGMIGQSDAVLPWQVNRAEKRVRLQVAQLADKGRVGLFVSEENMLGSMRGVLDDIRLYPDAGARVARFAAGLRDHNVTLALALRCYDTWWASVLGFRLTRGGPLPHRGLCDRLITQPRRWRHVIADLAQALPDARLVVWTHEAMADRPDALIARLTGLTLDLDGAGARLNSGAAPDDLRTYLDDCGRHPGVIRSASGRFMPFDPHQRAILRAQYAEDLAWLAAGAGGLADYVMDPEHRLPRHAGQGKGPPDDRNHGQLAQAR